LGGRAAEQVFIGEISTGAGNDLERATEIIKAMASVYGMSEVAGLMVLSRQTNQFLGGGQTSKDYSDKLAQDLDQHIKNTLNERYDHVVKTLSEYRESVELMTKELLAIEVISGERVRELIKQTGKEIYEGGDLHQDGKNNL